jgi:hypothetical protein
MATYDDAITKTETGLGRAEKIVQKWYGITYYQWMEEQRDTTSPPYWWTIKFFYKTSMLGSLIFKLICFY